MDNMLLQFIDLCILLGCDYCDSIRGIGPKRAIDLMKQHKSIDTILKHLDKSVSLIFLWSEDCDGTVRPL